MTTFIVINCNCLTFEEIKRCVVATAATAFFLVLTTADKRLYVAYARRTMIPADCALA